LASFELSETRASFFLWGKVLYKTYLLYRSHKTRSSCKPSAEIIWRSILPCPGKKRQEKRKGGAPLQATPLAASALPRWSPQPGCSLGRTARCSPQCSQGQGTLSASILRAVVNTEPLCVFASECVCVSVCRLFMNVNPNSLIGPVIFEGGNPDIQSNEL